MSKEEWIADSWCIFQLRSGKWGVGFGDQECYATSGSYIKRRRAKKEITHYINAGLFRMRHGALAKH